MKKILIFLFLLFPSLGFAATHYVSPTGSDTWANSINIDTPCSLTTAIGAADDDDLVYLRGGTYSSVYFNNPTNSGSAGHLIAYENYTGETPIISGGSYGIYLNGKSYIKFKGISFSSQTVRWVYFLGSTHNIIESCTFDNVVSSPWVHMYFNTGSDYNILDTITATGNDLSESSNVQQDLIIFANSDHNLVINSDLSDVSHDTLRFGVGADYNVAWKNTIHNKWRHGLTIWATRNLAHGNTFYGMGASSATCPYTGDRNRMCPAIYLLSCQYCIVRYNHGYENNDGIFCGGTLNYLQYNWIYHNTFYDATPAGSQGYSGEGFTIMVSHVTYTSRYEHFINNIFWKCDDAYQAMAFNDSGGAQPNNNTYAYNFIGDPVKASYVRQSGTSNTLKNIQDAYSSQWHDNILDGSNNPDDPEMIAPDSQNFNLDAGSPAIDAATHLTLTNGTGNGTTAVVTVDDATPFFSGPGAPWYITHASIAADTIYIEDTGEVQILSIDYTNKQLTLTANASWGDGKKIYVCPDGDCFYGTAPDIGAYESAPVAPSGTITSGFAGGNVNESHIVAGLDGDSNPVTLVLTCDGTTWVATAGDDNAITTAIIAGLTSAQSEAGGWNAKVKTVLTHANVTRQDANTLIIVIPAIADFEITANETITCTSPATATEAGIEIVGYPTVTISNVSAELPAGTGGMIYSSDGASAVYDSGGKTILSE